MGPMLSIALDCPCCGRELTIVADGPSCRSGVSAFCDRRGLSFRLRVWKDWDGIWYAVSPNTPDRLSLVDGMLIGPDIRIAIPAELAAAF